MVSNKFPPLLSAKLLYKLNQPNLMSIMNIKTARIYIKHLKLLSYTKRNKHCLAIPLLTHIEVTN